MEQTNNIANAGAAAGAADAPVPDRTDAVAVPAPRRHGPLFWLRSHAGYLAFLPFAIVVICYELLPLLDLVRESFIGKDSGTLGLENYIKIFTTTLYQNSIINSVRISLVSAAVGIVVAFLTAHFVNEASPRVRQVFTMILNMMSNFAGVPLAFAFMLLMGNAGVFTLIGKTYNIPFLSTFDLYTGDGLTVLYIYFQIPLGTLLLIPAFSGVRKEWREAATILKATSLDYWFRIVIPNLIPSILGTFSVLFSNALAAYATAYAIMLNNYALLALQITAKFKGDVTIDEATGGALAVVLILLMIACSLINSYFTKKASQGRELV